MKRFIFIAALLMLAGCTGSPESVPASFAQCVTDSGAVMYGAFWCPHCQEQKEMFGSSFEYIDYVECDPRGENSQSELCIEKGIEGYPTWIFGDGEKRAGKLPLEVISARTGCELQGE